VFFQKEGERERVCVQQTNLYTNGWHADTDIDMDMDINIDENIHIHMNIDARIGLYT